MIFFIFIVNKMSSGSGGGNPFNIYGSGQVNLTDGTANLFVQSLGMPGLLADKPMRTTVDATVGTVTSLSNSDLPNPISTALSMCTIPDMITYNGSSNKLIVPNNKASALTIQDSKSNTCMTVETDSRPRINIPTELSASVISIPGGLFVIPGAIYTTGTASASLGVVTGVGTTFTTDMIGGVIYWPSTGNYGLIATFNSATSLATNESFTQASSTFVLYYQGLVYDANIRQLSINTDGFSNSMQAENMNTTVLDSIDETDLGIGTNLATSVTVAPPLLIGSSIDTSTATGMTIGEDNATSLTITPTTTFGGSVLTASLDTASATTLVVGGANATAMSIHPTTTFFTGALSSYVDTPLATSMNIGTANATAISIGSGTVPVTITKPLITSFTNGIQFNLPSTDGTSSTQTPMSTDGGGTLSMSPLLPMVTTYTISSTTAIGACYTTPIGPILAAPGSGKYIYIHSATLNYKGGTIAATSSQNLWLTYGNGANDQVNTATNTFGNHGTPTTSSANANYLTYALGGIAGGAFNAGPAIYSPSANVLNQAIYMTASGLMAVGNPTATVTVFYSILPGA